MKKSIRLNKQIREDIIENVLNAWLAEHPAPETSERPSKHTLAKAVYEDWYVQAKIDMFLASGLPRDLFHRGYRFKVQVIDEETHNQVDYFTVDLDNIYKDHNHGNHVVPPHGVQVSNQSPMYLEYRKARKEWDSKQKVWQDWRTARDNYTTEIRAVLNSVNTTKQLLEAWPEIEKFMPSGYRDPSSVQLPQTLPDLPTNN